MDIEEKTSSILSQMPAHNNEQIDSLMQELVNLDQDGLNEIIKRVKPAGHGDDSQARFALGSMAFYLTKTRLEQERTWYSNTLTKAINTGNKGEVNAFYMSLLQIAGTNEAVPALASYLDNEKLCDPAVRALVDINSVESEDALINALNTTDVRIQTSLVEGLGYMQSLKSAKRIRELSKTDKPDLKKVCLYALANIPDIKAESLLVNEAKNAGF
ncbi:MAG: HEAT repeat domain-containing protein, partial [Bacteroidota bacterium]|nr:HEAT repeat domain-containing protein [Bacteroidota bacterium]